MKRWLIFGVVVLALMALLVPAALAQGVTPPATAEGCPMWEQGGVGGMMGRGGVMDRDDMPGRGGAMMGGWAGLPDEALTLLGLSADEVQAEHLAGKTLAEIATAQGVTTEKLVDAILATRVDALATLVKDGKLSQAQADLMTERMKDMVTEMVERDDVGPMWNDDEDRSFGPMWDDDSQGGGRGQGMRGQGMRGGQQFNRQQSPMQQPTSPRGQWF
jgi:hypothetical protein